MPPIPVEERELNELDEQITDLASTERSEREAADQVLARIREEGRNPATDQEAFDEVDTAYKSADEALEQLTTLRDRRSNLSAAGQPGRGGHRPRNAAQGTVSRSLRQEIARRFAESEELSGLLKRGVLGTGSQFATDAVQVADRDETRAMLAATYDGLPLIPDDQRLFPPINIPIRQIGLLDLITIGDTDSDTIKWVEQTVRTDASAGVAKGALAPEATYTDVLRTTEVKRRAHFLPAHEDELADQGQLRTLLEGRLADGVRLDVESNALAGDGLGENWTGILTAAIDDQPLGLDTIPDAIHKGITNVRINRESEPTAVGMHPLDWERYVLAKDDVGNYLNLHATTESTMKQAWGLPAFVSTLFTEGTAVVGKYTDAALWIREGVTTQATNAYEDFFRRYMVAMRSGFRGAFAVQQARGFTSVSGLNA